jgi:hypothetical protein
VLYLLWMHYVACDCTFMKEAVNSHWQYKIILCSSREKHSSKDRS